MAEFPKLPLWTDAYLGDTTHLSTLEHGAYLLLLITAWRTSDCTLPDDDRLLARYARLNAAQWKRVRPILSPFFRVEDGRWVQGRLLDEREAVKRFHGSQSEKGAKGGAAKALKTKQRHLTGDKSGHTPAVAQGKPKSDLPSPIYSATNVAGASAPPSDPIKQMFDLGVEVLTAAGSTPKAARSLIGKWRGKMGDAGTLQALMDAKAQSISDPVAWIEARVGQKLTPLDAALESARRARARYAEMGIVEPPAGHTARLQ